MNIVLFEPGELDSQGIAVLRDRRAAHIRSVLLAREGKELRAGVVDGNRGTARVCAVEGEAVTMHCRFEQPPPPEPTIDLLLALPRPKVLKRLWAPLAALGVRQIVITNAARVERAYFDTHWLNPAHFGPLLREGLEQAGDTRLPRVHCARRFKPFVEDELDARFPAAVRLIAHPAAAVSLPPPQARSEAVLIAVGPEGGWTDFERALLHRHAFRDFSLGPRTLRTDCACIAVVSLLRSLAMGIAWPPEERAP